MTVAPLPIRSALAVLALLGASSAGPLVAQDVVITEVMAINDGSIADENGETVDWAEIQNQGPTTVNLDGWFLTDEPAVGKWRFPSVEIPGGGFLIVFCSGKNRATEGEEPHTNFRLSGDGEYLGLLRPDGSVEHEYSPQYPRQRSGYSYGIAQAAETSTLISAGDDVRVRVPVNSNDGLAWTLPGYDDSTWDAGVTGVGYDTSEDLGPPGEGENVAGQGTATHSSQLGGFGATLGNDGDYSNFTHTAAGQNLPSTWELDLGEVVPIDVVVLHNRTSCCGSRLRDITVSVLDAAQAIVYESPLLNPENSLGSPPSLQVDPGIVAGRYIRVVRTPDPDLSGGAGNSDEADVLSLGEVEVFRSAVVGYHSLIQTNIESAMHEQNSSAYVRVPFELEAAPAVDILTLRMQYDDGFVAYLNGVEVARRNAPGVAAWNSSATDERQPTDAFNFEDIVITDHQGLLQAGENVLAIHGLNHSAADSNFLVVPELVAQTVVDSAERYFENPTPGGVNDPDGVIGFVADTKFTHNRGFYDEPFSVEITTETEGAQIRYTTDTSTPSSTRGAFYSGPIQIDETTVLRAVAFRNGLQATDVDTHTYIFLDDVIASNVMDTAITQHAVYGPQMRDALTDLPTISLVTQGTLNKDSEIRTSIEIIPSDRAPSIQENAGIKYFGGNHTNFPKKNFRVYFRSEYGAKKLRYPLYDGFDNTRLATETFDKIELRTGSHDMNQRGFYMSNRFTDDTMLEMGHVNPHGRFVHVYLDGTYWGQYHLRERFGADMFSEYMGGDSEDYEAIVGNRDNWSAGIPYDGDGSTWTQINALNRNYEAVREYVDIPAYIDFMIMFSFGNSELEYRSAGPIMPGSGGFKMLLNDADGFTRDTGDRTTTAGPGGLWSGLWSAAHPDYRMLVGDRLHRQLFNDGALTPAQARDRLLARTTEIERAFFAESARWGFRTPSSWESAKNSYVNGVLPSRTGEVLGYYRSSGRYPSTEAPSFNVHGGLIDPSFVLAMSAPAGTVYYGLDGEDPRLPGGGVSPNALVAEAAAGEVILAANAPVRVLVPTDDSLGSDWTEVSFDDGAWRSGTTGVGYENTSGFEGEINTDVGAEMSGETSTVYMRQEFHVDDRSVFVSLNLRMKYDDGFVAYLNGTRVASALAPSTPTWNSAANGSHPDADALVFEDFDITEFLGRLRNGTNVLAIHGLNSSPSSTDFLISPAMTALTTGENPGVTFDGATVVKARARVGNQWSAVNEAFFYFDVPLRITELMYHPREAELGSPYEADDFEFVEMQNMGSQPIDLAGFRLGGGITFEFPENTGTLPPGGVILVVRNLEAYLERYPFAGATVAGEYSGRLSNAGDRVVLEGASGEPILDFRYSDLWYPETDGLGWSLVLRDIVERGDAWSEAMTWRPSDGLDGSPGSVEVTLDGGLQIPGDISQDGSVDISDPLNLLFQLFAPSAPSPPCDGSTIVDGANVALADANGDGSVNATDGLYLLNYLFLQGPAPSPAAGCIRIEGCPSVCTQ